MARNAIRDVGRDRIDSVMERFKSECLQRDGSLLFGDLAVWAPGDLEDLRRRMVDDPLHGKGTFQEKLAIQLRDASDTTRLLAVEMLAVYFLFAYGSIGEKEKVRQLVVTAQPLNIESAPHWPEVKSAMGQGIGNPGAGYNVGRYEQISYFIDFVLRWKELDAAEQTDLLRDPRALARFADSAGPVREMRHVLLHLLAPDEFERMSSGNHKKLIVDTFGDKYLEGRDKESDDVDEQLRVIRRGLEADQIQPAEPVLDFYSAPLVDQWRPTKKPKPEATSIKVHDGNAWIFQTNPKLFNLDSALDALPTLTWVVRRHKDAIHAGDRVFIWQSGPDAGIVAVGHVASEPTISPEPAQQAPFWLADAELQGEELRAPVTIDTVLQERLTKDDLRNHPVLNRLKVIRAPTGTNFEVSGAEVDALNQLLSGPQEDSSEELCFILNQLEIVDEQGVGRPGYMDVEGEVYMWKSKSSGAYRELALAPAGSRFAYYRPRSASDGTAQTYFGAGTIESISDVTQSGDEHSSFRAVLGNYHPFDKPVPLREGPKRNPQTSIERVSEVDFNELLRKGTEPLEWIPLSLAKVSQAASASGLILETSTLASLVSALNSGKHIILTGPPGTAKTTLAQLVAEVATEAGSCSGFLPTTATADWTTFETIGGLRPQGDTTLRFEEGHFLSSIRDRQWLIIDELNRSNFDRALGQLFTVLSGQPVVLPYHRGSNRHPIVLVPHGSESPIPNGDQLDIGEGWRVIATMNVFDKSLLFEMSYALMRRFAFIEVPSPGEPEFKALVAEWSEDSEAAIQVAEDLMAVRAIKDIGPAPFRDIIGYVRQRELLDAADAGQLRFECFYSFLLPQFEGIEEEQGRKLLAIMNPLVGPELRNRLRTTLESVLGLSLSSRARPDDEESAIVDPA